MPSFISNPAPVFRPRTNELIASSKRLRDKLLPEGPITSPYEILDYHATLVLTDADGMTAKFHRTQRIRFLQDGVAGILDHAWGDGVLLTFYHNDAGKLEDWFNDEGRHHLVIGLKKAMSRGETLTFRVSRTAMVGFSNEEEWLETTIDHSVRRVKCDIVFPKERPCRRATLAYRGRDVPLPVKTGAKGQTKVSFDLTEPLPHLLSMVRWTW